MNFINPLVLIGLVAAAIPVLLHLLNLRKLKTIEFSSLKFLKELQKTKIRKLKLKQILLLILRTLLIIFAVLAFARPTIPGSIPYFETYAKTSAVIIADNSFSLDMSDEYGSRFKQIKSAAKSIINNLNDGDEIAIITMSGESSLSPMFTRNFDFALEKLDEVKVSLIPANLNKSLRVAESILQDAANLNKEIYILSDAQQNTFNLIDNDTVRIKSELSSAFYLPIGAGSNADLQNLSIDSVRIISRIFQQDKLVEVEAFVRNNSKNIIKDVVASMKFNDKSVSQRSADINSGETKAFTIAATPGESGAIKAKIELESDIQEIDNSRFFGFNIPPKPKILAAGPKSENPYINIALTAFSDENGNNIRKVSSEQLSSENFINYDVIILHGGKLNSGDYTRLNQYILSGGSLILFANEETNLDEFSEFLKKSGIGNIKERNYSNSDPASFTNVDKNHPLFEGVFDDKPGSSQIESPKIFKSLPSESGLALISIPGGAFLSESKIGSGKVLYFAVTPDTEWSNFPLTGVFPTLLYRSILYITSSEDLSTNIKAGESLIYKIPAKHSNSGTFRIADPNSNEFFVQSIDLPQGKVLSLEKLIIPGIYTIFDEKDSYVAQIAVNPDETEFVLNQFDNDNLEEQLKDRITEAPITIFESAQDISSGIKRVRTGTELWQIFILLALLSAIAEMIVQRVTKNEVEGV